MIAPWFAGAWANAAVPDISAASRSARRIRLVIDKPLIGMDNIEPQNFLATLIPVKL